MLFNRSDDEGDPINLTEEQKEQLKKERVELKKIEEMENLIAKAVETSDEEEESEDPEVYKVISLGKNGLDSFEKGLPERRLLNLVKEDN